MDEVLDKCGILLPGQEFLKGVYSQRVPDMEALTSELAHQTRHPPPGESSPAETPEIVVHEGSATSARTGNLSHKIANLKMVGGIDLWSTDSKEASFFCNH